MTRPRWRLSGGITKLDRLSKRKFSNKFAKVIRSVWKYHERRTFVLFCAFWKNSWSRVEEEHSLGGAGLSQGREGSPPTDAVLFAVKRKACLAILKWAASLKHKIAMPENILKQKGFEYRFSGQKQFRIKGNLTCSIICGLLKEGITQHKPRNFVIVIIWPLSTPLICNNFLFPFPTDAVPQFL